MEHAIDLLVIAAHPDDAEISMGGTLLVAKERGWRTGVIDLSRGELSSRGSPEGREQETLRATELLGLSHRECLDLGDGAIRDTPEGRAALARAIRTLRPRVVFAPWKADLHPDHAGAGQLLEGVWYLLGVGKFAPGVPPYRPHLLGFYMLHTRFEPSVVIDITAVWERKMTAIRAYRSQFHQEGVEGPATKISQPHFLQAVEGRDRDFGFMAGCEFGEPIRWLYPARVADPVTLLAGWGAK